MLRWQPHRFVSYPVQVKRNAYRHVSRQKPLVISCNSQSEAICAQRRDSCRPCERAGWKIHLRTQIDAFFCLGGVGAQGGGGMLAGAAGADSPHNSLAHSLTPLSDRTLKCLRQRWRAWRQSRSAPRRSRPDSRPHKSCT